MRLLGLVLLVAILAAGSAPLAADPPPANLKDLVLGEHWFGREIGLDDLEGKVVLFVLWGT
jgi:hypothetical protein